MKKHFYKAVRHGGMLRALLVLAVMAAIAIAVVAAPGIALAGPDAFNP